MTALLNDVRYALRQLRKSPGFTVVAVLTLALGIGANVAIFGIVNELLFKPRAVSRPDELAAVGFLNDEGSPTMPNVSRPFYEKFRTEQHAFSDVIGYAWNRLKMQVPDGSKNVQAELVSGSYFQTLGVKPLLGRTLLPSDDKKPGDGAVAVISDRLWQRYFDSDPNVIGQTLRLDDQPIVVVGVAAEKFTGLDAWSVDIWLPTTLEPVFQEHTVYRLVGRLAPGVSRAQAQTDLQRVSQILAETYGRTVPVGYESYGLWESGQRVVLRSAGRGSFGPFYDTDSIWRAFFLFMSASGLVLLICCSNFANLLLVRMLKHRKETATRLALGALPRQIIRQLVIESLLLASLGAIVGIVLAVWIDQLLTLWKPANVRFMAEISPDWRVLIFCVLTALGTGLVFGLIPALYSMRFDLFPVLKNETVLDAGPRRFHLKHWLGAGQLALCLVLLVSAGLCLRSFARLLGVDPGFDTHRTMVASLDLELAGYTPEGAPSALLEVIERVGALPGVVNVTFSPNHPLDGAKATYIINDLEGYEPKAGEQIEFNEARVGPAFFRTVGMPLVQGNELRLRDIGLDQPRALINESFVRRYWPRQEVLGRRVMGMEVIGVVEDSRIFGLADPPAPLVFRKIAKLHSSYTHLLIRTTEEPSKMLPTITATLRSMNPRFSSVMPRPMHDILLNSLGPQRYTLTLISGFALVALMLAAVGIYGMMSYMVSLMTKEVGIRLSLGAQKQDIVRLLLRFSLRVISLGMLVGMPCAILATRFIRSELYEVNPLNPLALMSATVVLGLVTLVACWLPARRATKVDPMEALRYE